MRLHRFYIALILLLSFLTSLGKEYYFTHFNITDGLSQNTVHKILQDKTGFMWFATKDGLNRFDGRNFRRVDVWKEEGNNSYISTLFEDSNGKIWVGTHKGPYVYSPEMETLKPIYETEESTGNIHFSINDFEELPDGRILIAGEIPCIYSYNPADHRLTSHFDNTLTGLPSIMALCYSESGNVYIGTFGAGLYCADKNLKHIKKVTDINNVPYFDDYVINTIRKEGDRIYVGTANHGLHVLEESTGSISPVFTQDENGRAPFIRDINFDNATEILIGTETGLYIYDLADKEIKKHLVHDYFDRYSISDDAIYSIYFDREEGLWIGSYFGGIDYQGVRQPDFVKYVRNVGDQSLHSERIRELCRDPKGMIYVGSEDHGLSLFNPATGKFRTVDGVKEKNIHGLCIDGNNLWIGTFAEGIVRIDNSTGKISRYRAGENHGLLNNYVFSIYRTQAGDIYIGTFTGLQKYEREKDSFVDVSPLHGLFIYNIKEDTRGDLWIATYSNGLFRKEKGQEKWKNYREEDSKIHNLPSNKIYGIQEDSHGRIWVMTQNGPCVFIDEEFDVSFKGINRIPGVVYCMEEDEFGKYWLTSNHGIYCIDSQSEDIWNFTVKDGLTTNQFNYNSSLKTPDGKIYFGSIDGLISFDPRRFFPETEKEISPVISELYVHSVLMRPGDEDSPLDKSITSTDRLELESWQNSFALNVTTLSYNNAPTNKIKYRLKGYDERWNYIDMEEGLINYTNLSPGHYKFQAVATHADGSEVGQMKEMEVIVKTPFYKTWWAIMIYSLLGLGIISFIFIYHRRYSRLSNERYTENYKHTKEIELFDSKIKFFTNVAHEIRTPLTLIKAPLDTIIKREDLIHDPEIKDNLEVVNMNVDRLLQLADQLLDFRKMESGNYQITRKQYDVKELIEKILIRFRPTVDTAKKKLELELPENATLACIDREAFTKIVSNLITNAIKYSQSYIRISLAKSDGEIIFRIANDGKIISPEDREKIFSLFNRLDSDAPGTGIGLTFSRNLATIHGGTLYMEDSEEENIFVLRLPEGEEDSEKTETNESDLDEIIRNAGDYESVLIVEDNPELRDFLQKRLSANQYKVFEASNGEEALKILEESHIDIVVSDVMMPGMNGNELLKEIKGNLRFSHIPVILLTAMTTMKDKIEGLEAGADYYIEKPFSMEYLLTSMESLLRNRDRIKNRLETHPLDKIPEKGLTKTDEEFLKRMNEIITKNFSNPDFSVDDIITEMGLGSTTFYRKVKGLLNLNPNQYIKLQRLKMAAQLFREGYTSVSEVCYMVGFSSPGYFTKCFQQQFGIPPKEYMKGKV